MKKKFRKILLLLLVVAVVGALIAFLLNMKPETTDNEESSIASEPGEIAEVLIEKTDADIENIEFTFEDETYVINAMTETVKTSVESEESSNVQAASPTFFNIAGLEDYDVVTADVASAARSLYNLTSSKNLGSQDKLEDYGLSGKGIGQAELNYKDGSSDVIVIGDTAGSGAGRYILFKDSVHVVTSISESLLAKSYSFISKSIYAVADLEGVDEQGNEGVFPDQLDSLKLSGIQYGDPIEILYEPTGLVTYVMKTPIQTDASVDKIGKVVEALKSLSASQVILAGYSEKDLEEYGLAEPYVVAEFSMNSEKNQIHISEKDSDGNAYVIANETGIIYQISWASVAGWADLSLMDLRSSYIHLPNIQETTNVSLVDADSKTEFNISREKDEEGSTEASIKYILSITCDGKTVDYDTAYQPFYKNLISMIILSTDLPEYDPQAPILTVSYAYFDGGSDTLTFFEVADQDRYVVEKNGAFNGVLRKTTLDTVLSQVEATAANEAAE